MATELGVGVRVFLGWTNEATKLGKARLCQLATITAGPYSEEDLERSPWVNVNPPAWEVETDDGIIGIAHESILFPVDDWDESIDAETADPLEVVKQVETS